jgi:hypothetical protein
VKGKLKDSNEKGEIIEKIIVDIDKKKRQPIKSTEILVETFYFFCLPDEEPTRKLWIYDDILNDLLERGVKDMRIVNTEGLFYIDTEVFLNFGSVDRKKVYIDLDASTFDVYPNGDDFNVDVRDSNDNA